ncbi:MAG: lysine--tRNA ligase [Acidobacteriota bacterium]
MAQDQIEARIQKLRALKEAGITAYPERYERTHTLEEAMSLAEGAKGVRLAGRLTSIRSFGKLTFAHMQDLGGRLQIAFERKTLGDEAHAMFSKFVDIGDFLGVEGEIFRTRTGELTLRAAKLTFLGKSIRPLPEKWHGLVDIEACYRQRYLDLIMNPETRSRFLMRTRLIKAIRDYLDTHGFLEVETPALLAKASGALARPFVSHHQALGMDVYLRIAPETYLKRLIVGGYDRVYEFARCFRNEGISAQHLQDFTMLEYYCACWNYEDNMKFTQALIQHAVRQALGTTKVRFRGQEIEFAGEWPRVSFRDLLLRDAELDIARSADAPALLAEIRRRKIRLEEEHPERLGRASLIDAIYKAVSRPRLVQPTFLTGHPIEISPLARRNDRDPGIVDRFQLVAAGWEIVNAYSELVDPFDQRQRLEEQARARVAGDEEAMVMEEDYLLAMEYGMPPISGWGMGIDRLTALLAGEENIKQVVWFPLLRPLPPEETDSGD